MKITRSTPKVLKLQYEIIENDERVTRRLFDEGKIDFDKKMSMLRLYRKRYDTWRICMITWLALMGKRPFNDVRFAHAAITCRGLYNRYLAESISNPS